MATHRFKVTSVPEPNREDGLFKPTEIIPLISIENEIPIPPALPSVSVYTVSNNGKTKNRTSSRLFSKILQRRSSDLRRRATLAATTESKDHSIKKSASVDEINKAGSKSVITHSNSQPNAVMGQNVEETDAYSTVQSNNYDTNPVTITNKFLQELRLKRRELLEKAKNISIDQRIAFYRRQNQRTILRAQDIFDVHFEKNDDDDNDLPILESTLFTEEYQEKVRNDIYSELNRQRMKQYHKHHRHLILGRALLMFMTVLLIFMGLTLIYVVFDLYGRATRLTSSIPENNFIPMAQDIRTNLY